VCPLNEIASKDIGLEKQHKGVILYWEGIADIQSSYGGRCATQKLSRLVCSELKMRQIENPPLSHRGGTGMSVEGW